MTIETGAPVAAAGAEVGAVVGADVGAVVGAVVGGTAVGAAGAAVGGAEVGAGVGAGAQAATATIAINRIARKIVKRATFIEFLLQEFDRTIRAIGCSRKFLFVPSYFAE